MQNILRSFQQDLFAYHAGAKGAASLGTRAAVVHASPPHREFEGPHVSRHSTQHRARLVHNMRKLVPLMVHCEKRACALHYQVDRTSFERVLRFWCLIASC